MGETSAASGMGTDVVAAMRAFETAHNLRQEAEASCRRSILSAAEENSLDGLSPDVIEIVFERCSLVFNHGVLTYPFVETRFGLYVPDPVAWDKRRRVGHYRLITLLDGRVDDDYLVLEGP